MEIGIKRNKGEKEKLCNHLKLFSNWVTDTTQKLQEYRVERVRGLTQFNFSQPTHQGFQMTFGVWGCQMY